MTETYRSSTLQAPLALDGGGVLTDVTVAYETYGALAPDRTNAILLCHALTGDQFVASAHPVTGKPGWWERMVGPGRPIDTDRYHVVCANVIGSCMGSTGPASLAPDGEPYAMRFPVITIRDMVRGLVGCSTSWGSSGCMRWSADPWAGCRRSALRPTGPSAPDVCSPSPPPRGIRRRTSPSTKWGDRRSWPTRIGARAITTPMKSAPAPGSRSRGWRRISPICPKTG